MYSSQLSENLFQSPATSLSNTSTEALQGSGSTTTDEGYTIPPGLLDAPSPDSPSAPSCKKPAKGRPGKRGRKRKARTPPPPPGSSPEQLLAYAQRHLTPPSLTVAKKKQKTSKSVATTVLFSETADFAIASSSMDDEFSRLPALLSGFDTPMDFGIDGTLGSEANPVVLCDDGYHNNVFAQQIPVDPALRTQEYIAEETSLKDPTTTDFGPSITGSVTSSSVSSLFSASSTNTPCPDRQSAQKLRSTEFTYVATHEASSKPVLRWALANGVYHGPPAFDSEEAIAFFKKIFDVSVWRTRIAEDRKKEALLEGVWERCFRMEAGVDAVAVLSKSAQDYRTALVTAIQTKAYGKWGEVWENVSGRSWKSELELWREEEMVMREVAETQTGTEVVIDDKWRVAFE